MAGLPLPPPPPPHSRHKDLKRQFTQPELNQVTSIKQSGVLLLSPG